jgi:hypothetical protein
MTTKNKPMTEKPEKLVVNILAKGDGWDEIESAPPGLIYAINDAFLRTPGVNATFHIHDMEAFYNDPKTHSSTKLCIDAAIDNPEMDFFTTKNWKKIPHSKAYPLDEVSEYFGTSYFASTIEYAMAYAMWKHREPGIMNLYGVNMTVKQEYIDQKPGVEFWVGMAMGRGWKVNLQKGHTSILKTRNGLLYGYNSKQFGVNE